MVHDKKEIVISGESLLKNVQDAFSAFYPFLMIEFIHNVKSDTIQIGKKLPGIENLKALAGLDKVQKIDVSGKHTVSEVVGDIASLFRVKAQVYRKSGNVWNAVSLTDGWTLERQNTAGEYISGIMGAPV